MFSRICCPQILKSLYNSSVSVSRALARSNELGGFGLCRLRQQLCHYQARDVRIHNENELKRYKDIWFSETKVATVAMVKSGCLNDKSSPTAENSSCKFSKNPATKHPSWIQRLRVLSQSAFTVSLSGFSWMSALENSSSNEIREFQALHGLNISFSP